MSDEIRGKISLDASGVRKGTEEAKGHADKLPGHAAGVSSRLASVFGGLRERVSGAFGGLSGSIAGSFARLAPLVLAGVAAVGLGGGIYGIVSGVSKQIEKAVQLTALSRQTGQGVGGLMQLGKAFTESGLEAEGLGMSIGRLQNALAGVNEDGEDTSSIFARLNLDVAQLKTLGAPAQYYAIGRAISSLASPLERTAAARAIWGRSGSEVLRLFENPEAMAGLTKPLTSSQKLLESSARLLSQFSVAWEAFKGRAKQGFGLFAGLAAGLAPGLSILKDMLPKWDFSAFGERLGRAVSIGLAALKDGTFGDLFSTFLQLGITRASAFFTQNFSERFSEIAENLRALLVEAFGSRLAGAIESSLKSAIWSVIAEVLKGLRMVSDELGNLIWKATGGDKPIADAVGDGFKEAFENGAEVEFLEDAAQKAGKGFAEAFAAAGSSNGPGKDQRAGMAAVGAGLSLGNRYNASDVERLNPFSDANVASAQRNAAEASADAKKGFEELGNTLRKFVPGFGDPLIAQFKALGFSLIYDTKIAGLLAKSNAASNAKAAIEPKDDKNPLGSPLRFSSFGVSALQRIGGGGGFGGGDALLDTTRSMARSLAKIEKNTANPKPERTTIVAVPRFA